LRPAHSSRARLAYESQRRPLALARCGPDTGRPGRKRCAATSRSLPARRRHGWARAAVKVGHRGAAPRHPRLLRAGQQAAVKSRRSLGPPYQSLLLLRSQLRRPLGFRNRFAWRSKRGLAAGDRLQSAVCGARPAVPKRDGEGLCRVGQWGEARVDVSARYAEIKAGRGSKSLGGAAGRLYNEGAEAKGGNRTVKWWAKAASQGATGGLTLGLVLLAGGRWLEPPAAAAHNVTVHYPSKSEEFRANSP